MAPADRLLGWPASAARPADPSALPRAGRKRSRVVESVPQRRHCPAEHAGQDGARSHASLPQQLRGHHAPVAPARTREGIGNPRVPPGCCLVPQLPQRSPAFPGVPKRSAVQLTPFGAQVLALHTTGAVCAAVGLKVWRCIGARTDGSPPTRQCRIHYTPPRI
jgi:hypothetical protein